MKKSLSIQTMFTDTPLLDRFALVRRAGFDYVELGDWTELDITGVNEGLARHGLTLSCMAGSRGHSLTDPEQRDDFLEFLSQSIAVAKNFGCGRLVIESHEGNGTASAGKGARSNYTKVAAVTRVLMDAAEKARRGGLTLLLKPTSTYRNPHAFLHTTPSAGDVVRVVNSPSLLLLYDVTQMQVMEGDILSTIRKYRDFIGYVHVGGGDSLFEENEVNLELFRRVLCDELHYDGFVGFECTAEGDCERCLESIRRF